MNVQVREFTDHVQAALHQMGLHVYRTSAGELDVEVLTGNHERLDEFTITITQTS